MRKLIKPPKLISGDTVGIVSPASAFFPINESAFQRGIAYLEQTGLHDLFSLDEGAIVPNYLMRRAI